MRLLPRNEEFYDLLEQLSGHMRTSAQELQKMTGEYPHQNGSVNHIRDEERTASDLSLRELKRLDSAFITPLDREDIMRLMSDLQSVVTGVAQVAYRLEGFQPKALGDMFRKEADALQQLVEVLDKLIRDLRNERKLADLDEDLQQIRVRRDALYDALRAATAATFSDGISPVEAIKNVDLNNQIQAVAERCDSVLRTVQHVLLKNS